MSLQKVFALVWAKNDSFCQNKNGPILKHGPKTRPELVPFLQCTVIEFIREGVTKPRKFKWNFKIN